MTTGGGDGDGDAGIESRSGTLVFGPLLLLLLLLEDTHTVGHSCGARCSSTTAGVHVALWRMCVVAAARLPPRFPWLARVVVVVVVAYGRLSKEDRCARAGTIERCLLTPVAPLLFVFRSTSIVAI
jgi:hypothetical protein